MCWTENTVAHANICSSHTKSFYRLNWHYATHADRTTEALNLLSSKNGNLDWTILSFANSSTRRRAFWNDPRWTQMHNLDWPLFGAVLVTDLRHKSSRISWPLIDSKTVSNCGTSSMILAPTQKLVSRRPSFFDPTSVASPSATPCVVSAPTSKNLIGLSLCKPSTTPSHGWRESLLPELPHVELPGLWVQLWPTPYCRFLRQWHLRVLEHQVPCHVPSFKTIFIKHASVVDILCSHKSAVESWSSTTPPVCWQKYKKAVLNPNSTHWVMSGSLLGTMISPELAVAGRGISAKQGLPFKARIPSVTPTMPSTLV